MRYLFVLLMAIGLVLDVSCVKQGNQESTSVTKMVTVKKKLLVNHTKDYKTMAQSIRKISVSKEFQYDNQYAIPDVDGEASENSSALIIPPESKR